MEASGTRDHRRNYTGDGSEFPHRFQETRLPDLSHLDPSILGLPYPIIDTPSLKRLNFVSGVLTRNTLREDYYRERKEKG